MGNNKNLALDTFITPPGPSSDKKKQTPSNYFNKENKKNKNNWNGKSVFLKKKGVLYKVLIDEILFIKAQGEYTMTYTERDKFMNLSSLNKIADFLEEHYFFRIHRSYVINLNQVRSIDVDASNICVGGIDIPVSRSRKPALMKLLNMVE